MKYRKIIFLFIVLSILFIISCSPNMLGRVDNVDKIKKESNSIFN